MHYSGSESVITKYVLRNNGFCDVNFYFTDFHYFIYELFLTSCN